MIIRIHWEGEHFVDSWSVAVYQDDIMLGLMQSADNKCVHVSLGANKYIDGNIQWTFNRNTA